VRAYPHLAYDIDAYLEDATRAEQQLEAERWRAELRPRELRMFAARSTKLHWSRALLKTVVEELFPDELFAELAGNLDRVPARRWPQVVAIAVALRHSWRRDGVPQLAKRLRLSLPTTPSLAQSQRRRIRPSRHRFSGSPRRRQGSPLRFDRARRGLRP